MIHEPQSGGDSAIPFRRRLRDFFYAEEVPYSLAVVRITLPLVMLIAAVPRWFHARELYSTDGAPAPLANSYGFAGLVPEPSAAVAVALCTLWVFCLVTTSIGWWSRLSACIAGAVMIYLGLLDMIGTLTKFTVIAAHILLLLSVSSCGAVWSIDAWLSRRGQRDPFDPSRAVPRSPVWPRRLVQLLICSTYFGAAITKLQTPLFFSGDQMLFWLLSNVNTSNPLGELASLYPPLLVVMGLVTIVWEILFPFLCWRGTGRAVMLGLGALFHLMTWLLLGLVIFPMVCLSAYWAFCSEQDMQAIARTLRRWGRRSRVVEGVRRVLAWRPGPAPQWLPARASGPAFGAVLCLLVLIGIETERQMDVYGMRRPEGPYSLPVVSDDVAATMLSATESVRPIDKLFTFQVGTATAGNMLADRRSTFQQGERAILECSLIPPHEDLWVEVNLHDAQDRVIHRVGQVVPREKLRGHFYYDLKGAFLPGEYDFVLRFDGQEVTRRRVTLVAGRATTQPVASVVFK